MSHPKAQLILSYQEFFGKNPPHNRLDLIRYIPFPHLITEILALNYRLKPANELHVDSSLSTQIRELDYFTQIDPSFQNVCRFLFRRHIDPNPPPYREAYPLLFTRQACLFATEEILNAQEMAGPDERFRMTDDSRNWFNILQYLIAVNDEITQYKQTPEAENLLESINAKLLPLQELTVEVNSIFTPYRGLKLIGFIAGFPGYTNQIETYLRNEYDVEPDEFIFRIIAMYYITQGSEFEFFYRINREESFLYDRLSERHTNADTHKLISIRKSPFIKIYEEMYLISDISFLLEKAYSQLINDFWFDYIKHLQSKPGKIRYPISQYRSMIGYFFESYVAQILKASFQHYHQAKLLVFDELKLTVKKAPIELADFYLRADHNLLVGQVKSASIYDNQKYGGDITALYKGNRKDFFSNFGVDQLIQSILNLQQYGQQLDPTFQASEAYAVYPVILVNDKALCSTLMANVFNERFQELLVTIPTPLFTVKPLSLIHINELERMEYFLTDHPHAIWDILEVNTRDEFIPQLFDTLSQFDIGYQFPARIQVEFQALIDKFGRR